MADSLGKLATGILAAVPAKASETAVSHSSAVRPALVDREADYEIPARVYANWAPERGARPISRELTVTERATLQRRSFDLEASLRPFTPVDRDVLDGMLSIFFSGYRQVREVGESAENLVMVALRDLREFPAWLIIEGCERIKRQEIVIDPPLNPRFPPNDGQLIAVMRAVAAPYRDQLTKVTALLAAPVETTEERCPPRRPKLPPVEPQVPRVSQFGDGKHHERVAADLVARRIVGPT